MLTVVNERFNYTIYIIFVQLPSRRSFQRKKVKVSFKKNCSMEN